MAILFDNQIFDLQKYGGISRYFSELLRYIPETQAGVLFTSNYYLHQNDKVKSFKFLGNRGFKGKNFIERNINRTYSKKRLKDSKVQLFHPTYYDPYFIGLTKKPIVITVHDMTHEIFNIQNKIDSTIENKRKLVYAADKIIAVSQNTKNDILNYYQDISPNKISVVYHGNNIIKSSSNYVNTYGRYLLYVGDRHMFKNFKNFIFSVTNILKKEIDLKVICVGRPFNEEETKLLVSQQIEDRVMQIRVSDQQLGNLYKNAQAFIFPSTYEGFGIPILEAFANDCPVCLSNTSCFPEIGGDAALYFDPNNIESMQNTIWYLLNDEKKRAELIALGVKRVKEFSWKKCAAQTAEVYNSLF